MGTSGRETLRRVLPLPLGVDPCSKPNDLQIVLLLLLPDGTDLCHLTGNEKGMHWLSVLNEGRYLESFSIS